MDDANSEEETEKYTEYKKEKTAEMKYDDASHFLREQI